jgi:nicotinate-nucleotide adenylyltransferase
MRHVGLLGGTFDPIHYGHLAAAAGAMHLLSLDRVLFMPNRKPPHKGGGLVTASRHRAAMVQLAIAGNPGFQFESLELEREGPSYTIDTIYSLQQRYRDWRFAFIAGMDSLLQIHTWRQYETLLTLIDVVVVNRPGYAEGQQEAALAGLSPELRGRVQMLTIPGVDIASTDLREAAASGYPLHYLVPDAVGEYIQAHGLYR